MQAELANQIKPKPTGKCDRPEMYRANVIWKNIENMNNQINKELKDYTDQELANELAKRINDFSLDPIYLLYPLVVAGTQYLNWYNAEKVSKKEKQATK